LDWSHLAKQLPCKVHYERKDIGKQLWEEKEEGVNSYRMNIITSREGAGKIKTGSTVSYCVENSLWMMILTCRKNTEWVQALTPVRLEICIYKTISGTLSLQNQFHVSWYYLQFVVTWVIYPLL
jgi:hypothetical protein